MRRGEQEEQDGGTSLHKDETFTLGGSRDQPVLSPPEGQRGDLR